MKRERIIGITVLVIAVLGIILPAVVPPPSLNLSKIWFKKGFLQRYLERAGTLVYNKTIDLGEVKTPVNLSVSVDSGMLRLKSGNGNWVAKIEIRSNGNNTYDVTIEEDSIRVNVHSGVAIVYVNEKYVKSASLSVDSGMSEIELQEIKYPIEVSIKSSMGFVRLGFAKKTEAKLNFGDSFVNLQLAFPENIGIALNVETSDSYVTVSGTYNERITSGSTTIGNGGIKVELSAKSSFIMVRAIEQ